MAKEKEEYPDPKLFPVYSPDNMSAGQNELLVTMQVGDELIPGSEMFYRALREEFTAKEDDVWIITYPKTGTTWATEVVLNILAKADGEKVKEMKEAFETNGGLRPEILDYPSNSQKDGSTPVDGAGRVKEMNSGKGRRVFGSHIREADLPLDVLEKSKIVVVMRNPKDSCVSYYHFHRMASSLGKFSGTFSQFLDSFSRRKVMFGDWFDYTQAFWNKHHHRSNFLFLKYEDMKKNFPAALNQMSDFVGVALSEKEKRQVYTNTSFKQMDKKISPFIDEDRGFDQSISKFLRKGEIGDWKNHFTVAENEAYDKIYEKRMKDFEVTFDFE